MVRRDPHQFGLPRSRWTLHDLREQLPAWQVHTDGGMHQLLQRLDIHYKRARSYIHSPDPFYTQKRARQALIQARVQDQTPSEVVLFQDECSIRRQPSVGYNYEASGSDAPHAQWQPCYDTLTRIMATLDVCSGQVVYTLIGRVTTSALVRFYRKVRAAYPQARRIWLVQDNWPVHFHPDVLYALEPQECLYPVAFSPSWKNKQQPSPSVQRRKRQEPLPIQIVQLPTYASWCNPIEKLWRWLKQDFLHLHRCAGDLDQLRTHIRTFLDAFSHGSPQLLHYVGLSSN